ncbi:SPOSA6832_00838 [Sporobolomyces salmonicolor]|uniref:SPOSA6832_00838-mRNA-1:cds n=1 Tax=Sporidiobolus salmonicolor TaxID=5005 RepID=A0A0D6EH71_SPOSA|nr:SPOSA6832_00838 [Sporobolomyces salmonicolor]
MTAAAQAPSLAIPSDASTGEKLAHLARLKQRLVGATQRKAAVLKAGGVDSLVELLVSPHEPTHEDSLAVSAEAANVLGALSLPSIETVSILLSARAHQAVSTAFARVLGSTAPPPVIPHSIYQKHVESHLRALKTLYVDLVKVVGPREWGTDIIGASIDLAERRDAERLWHPATKGSAAANVKGKGKEEDVAMDGVEPNEASELSELQAMATGALEEVYQLQPLTATPPFAAGPSTLTSYASKDRLSPTLAALLDLLNECAQFEPSSAPPVALPQRLRVADLVCAFLAGTVRLPQQRQAIAGGARGKETLAALKRLVEHGSDKVREGALKALSAVVRDSHDAMLTLLNLGDGDNVRTRLHPFTLFAQSPNPSVRLAAATLCAVLAKLLYPPPALRIPEAELGAPATIVLLSLVEKEPTLRARAAFAFAYLVADEPDLQKRAAAAQCFNVLHKAFEQSSLHDQPYLTPASFEEDARGLLLALAAMTASSEVHRRMLLDAHLLPHLLASLAHPAVGVRAAACHCIRALSRSVNVLRTDLVESHAEGPLVQLLRDNENEVVKVTATAAVANLLLDFSPMRKALVEAGCVPRMCQLVMKSENEALKLNALWAIKNAVYQSSAEFKRELLVHLTWSDLASLIASPSPPEIVEQALGVLRNITCVTNNEAITGLSDAEMGEDRLLGLLEDRLVDDSVDPEEGERIILEVLYCLNNIATAHEAAQLAIASRTTLLQLILHCLDPAVPVQLRTAALWILHNLVYRRGTSSFSPSSSSGPAPPRRRRPLEIVEKLHALGLDAKLLTMERDAELDVRERVRDLKEAMA